MGAWQSARTYVYAVIRVEFSLPLFVFFQEVGPMCMASLGMDCCMLVLVGG